MPDRSTWEPLSSALQSRWQVPALGLHMSCGSNDTHTHTPHHTHTHTHVHAHTSTHMHSQGPKLNFLPQLPLNSGKFTCQNYFLLAMKLVYSVVFIKHFLFIWKLITEHILMNSATHLLCPKFYIDSCLLREHPDGHGTSEVSDWFVTLYTCRELIGTVPVHFSVSFILEVFFPIHFSDFKVYEVNHNITNLDLY